MTRPYFIDSFEVGSYKEFYIYRTSDGHPIAGGFRYFWQANNWIKRNRWAIINPIIRE